MKKYNVLKYDVVDDEIIEVVAYYRDISPTLGLRAQGAILQALYNLETKADYYGLLFDNKHRRIKINGFPYVLVYKVEGNTVIVKLLFPQKSDPKKLLRIIE